MNHIENAESELHATIRDGRAVLVAGTGVSIAASFDATTQRSHPQASWALALLWLAIGELDQAKHHALAAYRWAWADGEPYVNRYELTKATQLLQQMNVSIPTLPPYDPAKDEPFPWEADVRAAIEKLRAEKEAAAGKDAKSDDE